MTNTKQQLLGRTSIFSDLEDRELSELAELTVERRLRSGEAVFWEGDPPESFYAVAQGRVKAFKSSSLGREFVVAFFGPGEMFGEVAVFENRPYPASAQAVTDTTVLAIGRERYLRFLAAHPEVGVRIINVLAGRLRDAQGRLRDLAGERTEQRVARILLMLNARIGDALPFTRRDIAEMAGTTPETAIRIITRLRKAGIVRTGRGRIIIADNRRLRLLGEGPPVV